MERKLKFQILVQHLFSNSGSEEDSLKVAPELVLQIKLQHKFSCP